MNLSIIVIFSLFIRVLSEVYYKHQLRGYRQEEKDREVGELIEQVSDTIVSKVFEKAKEGELSYRFRVLCEPQKVNIILSNYGISCEDYTSSVLLFLRMTFLDSNFTQSTENGCDYHTITW